MTSNIQQIDTITRQNPSATITIGLTKQSMEVIKERLQQMADIKQSMRRGMEGVGDYMRTQVIPTTFQKEGPGWAPLAKRTQRERTFQGYSAQHPILKRTGDLYQELIEKSHPKHIESIRVNSNTVSFRFGGSSTKFIENQLGRSDLHLPARPMIPGTESLALPDRDKQAMVNIIQKAVEQSISKM